jgi:lysophospholipid acyltransferase (LPLAT)-like uncharacterized protein
MCPSSQVMRARRTKVKSMKIRNRWLEWLLAASIVFVSRLLFRTLRIHYLIGAPNTNPYTSDDSVGFIYCVWHDAIAYPMFAGRHVRTVALVSQHVDGLFLSTGLKMLGIGSVRGSSSRNGASALRTLLRLPLNTHVVVTPDGPRGPQRQIKGGITFLASRSGRAIIPTAFAAASCWRIPGRWTNLAIPKPFTRVYAIGGAPLVVNSHATPAELSAAQVQLQAEMDRLSELVDWLALENPQTTDRIPAVRVEPAERKSQQLVNT